MVAGSYWLDRIGWIVSVGLYRLDRIGWIVWIVLARSYLLDRIGCIVPVLVLVLLIETGFYALAGLLLTGWYGWTGWDGGGMEGPTLSGAGTEVPPFTIEKQRVVGSSGWHQLSWC